jgi:hypothetical protein
MEKISNLLVEVLASNYIKIIKSLITKIQWDEIDPDFNEIKVAAYKIIENIQTKSEGTIRNMLLKLNNINIPKPRQSTKTTTSNGNIVVGSPPVLVI